MKILKTAVITLGMLGLSAILSTLCLGSMLLTGSLDKFIDPSSLGAAGIFMVLACIGLAITLALLIASTIAIIDALSYPWRRENLLWDCWKTKTLPLSGFD